MSVLAFLCAVIMLTYVNIISTNDKLWLRLILVKNVVTNKSTGQIKIKHKLFRDGAGLQHLFLSLYKVLRKIHKTEYQHLFFYWSFAKESKADV